MRDMHNADLCDTLGNLVNRATNLCQKFCNGVVTDVPAPSNPPIANLTEILELYVQKMEDFEMQGGANVAIQGFRDVNRYLQEEAPWLKKGDEHEEFRQVVVRASLEAIYALTHLLLPFLPVGCRTIFEKLGKEPVTLQDLSKDCRNLTVGTNIQVGQVLYEKVSKQQTVKSVSQSIG
jgi:methionyl-tRNA synthetase